MVSPLVDATGPVPLEPGFTVSHQKLELDLDFTTQSLRGKTEITILPTTSQLKTVRLNCRQSTLTRLNVNGRGTSIRYHEPFAKARIHKSASVQQYHMLQQKIADQLKDHPEGELLVTLPKSVLVEDQSPVGPEASNMALPKTAAGRKRSFEESGLASTSGSRPTEEPNQKFQPIVIHIEFAIDNFRDGLRFVSCEANDLRYPHVYTRNLPFSGSACSVFPCVDDLTSRCTWDISVRCPRTLGAAFPKIPSGLTVVDERHGQAAGTSKSERGHAKISTEAETKRPPRVIAGSAAELKLTVVCSGEPIDEVEDPDDSTKKVASFICPTAISAQHVGFSVGPFEMVDLAEYRETDEEDRLGENVVSVNAYCLPGRADEVRNTCMPTARAIDFFTEEYGSYPFNSYSLCFVDDLHTDIAKTAAFSICSSRLLFPEDVLEPIDTVTRQLTEALASQWVGINIVPKTPADIWITTGMCCFITDMFMKKLCGNNDYRFRQKLAADLVCELDFGRPSLTDLGYLLADDPSQEGFMELKAPLVLFILDRRLTKSGGSPGISRIISRVFLNAKVGEIPNGCITMAQFARICEKLGHTKLEPFFQQWVHGSGCPRFVVTQRFNKKKMVIEMTIKQVQADPDQARRLDPKTFLRDVRQGRRQIEPPQPRALFTGPMTIRIHEADGTPYEHIIEVRDASMKVEIPYNTKYKRLKRNRRNAERNPTTSARAAAHADADEPDEPVLYCLGDILRSEKEVKDWRLTDWTKEQEDEMNQESYEWIRMDADFEWISQISLSMPWYMYLSQLQQDRDVAAQYESVQYIAKHNPSQLASTSLLRILMDKRYFHGVRAAAAHGLAKCAKDELDWIGLFHLEKAFQEMFCFNRSSMTRSNDFSDRTTYLLQCVIPQAVAEIRDVWGQVPPRAQRFLLDLLRLNDNSNNEYSDSHYLAKLMTALSKSLMPGKDSEGRYIKIQTENEIEDTRLVRRAVEEIDRYRRMDEYLPSYHNVYSIAALDCKRRLMKAGVIRSGLDDIMQATRPGNSEMLRLAAFDNLIDLGMLQQDMFMQYLLHELGYDPSSVVREGLRTRLWEGLAAIALGTAKENLISMSQDALIIETDAETQKRHPERTTNIVTALKILREEIAGKESLKKGLWQAIESQIIGLRELGNLLEICEVIFEPKTSVMVRFKLPHYWEVKHLGAINRLMSSYQPKGKCHFARSGRYRTAPAPPVVDVESVVDVPSSSKKVKRERSGATTKKGAAAAAATTAAVTVTTTAATTVTTTAIDGIASTNTTATLPKIKFTKKKNKRALPEDDVVIANPTEPAAEAVEAAPVAASSPQPEGKRPKLKINFKKKATKKAAKK